MVCRVPSMKSWDELISNPTSRMGNPPSVISSAVAIRLPFESMDAEMISTIGGLGSGTDSISRSICCWVSTP